MHNATERMPPQQRILLWALDMIEGWVVPALPRGVSRHRLIAWIDRVQAHLKPCADGEDDRRK
jgi:hypothetical protein